VSASTNTSVQVSRAQASFVKNLGAQSYNNLAAAFRIDGSTLIGTGTGTYQTEFMRLFGYPRVDLKTTSAASSAPIMTPMCVMAMDPTRMHTLFITTNSNLTVYAPDCDFYGNSNNTDDVIDPKDPGSYVVAKSVATIGGGHHYLGNVTPPPVFGTAVIADPLAKLAFPSVGGCAQNNYMINNQTMTLPPGTYCNGLTIQKGSNVSLVPGGTYIITNGKFTVDSATLKGQNANFVLSGSKSAVAWTNSVIQLSAPVSGPYAGIALMGDPAAGDGTFETTAAGSTIDIEGVFYMPGSYITWTNAGTPAVTSKWTAFIADGFNWDGSGKITINFDRKSSVVPYPSSLYAIPSPGSPRLLY
jgi:hypothetical protein